MLGKLICERWGYQCPADKYVKTWVWVNKIN